jgi:DNA polymerase-3 subunit epsilon
VLGAEFAVIDLETTGFYARGSDRVIEIAIVVVGRDGKFLDTYSTLINPNLDLGPIDVHGITGRDVAGAPYFSEVIGDICLRLRGRVIAAHNARFDLDFLENEFSRCGWTLPNAPRVCTMALGSRATGVRRLDACCQSLGIQHERAHSALGDANATAALLLACAECERDWQNFVAQVLVTSPYPEDSAWPSIPPSGRVVARGQSGAQRDSYLTALLDQLPSDGDATDEAEAAHLGLLDSVLEDRKVTPDERDALTDVALRWGIGSRPLTSIHDHYLRSLVTIARQDGVVTDAERRDLEDVQSLLAIDEERLNELLGDPAPAVEDVPLAVDFR